MRANERTDEQVAQDLLSNIWELQPRTAVCGFGVLLICVWRVFWNKKESKRKCWITGSLGHHWNGNVSKFLPKYSGSKTGPEEAVRDKTGVRVDGRDGEMPLWARIDRVQTSDAFWRSASALVSELSI